MPNSFRDDVSKTSAPLWRMRWWRGLIFHSCEHIAFTIAMVVLEGISVVGLLDSQVEVPHTIVSRVAQFRFIAFWVVVSTTVAIVSIIATTMTAFATSVSKRRRRHCCLFHHLCPMLNQDVANLVFVGVLPHRWQWWWKKIAKVNPWQCLQLVFNGRPRHWVGRQNIAGLNPKWVAVAVVLLDECDGRHRAKPRDDKSEFEFQMVCWKMDGKPNAQKRQGKDQEQTQD